MGKPKLLLPFNDSTILEQSVDNLLNSRVDEVIVVVGNKAREMTEKLAKRPVKIAVNPAYREGMSTSIVRGLSMIDRKTLAVMLVLADQPLIDKETINQLIETFLSHDKGIAIPAYQGKRGHPIIFSAKYKEELRELKGDAGGRQIIRGHPDDVLEVAVNSPSINIDIDTPENYHSYIGQSN